MRKNMLDSSSRADAELAQRLAHVALERVPGLAAAHVILALFHYGDGEHRSTAVELRKALESEPGRLGELMTYPFFDLTWLDRCRLLAPLRQTTTFAVLRRATAARVERALEAL